MGFWMAGVVGTRWAGGNGISFGGGDGISFDRGMGSRRAGELGLGIDGYREEKDIKYHELSIATLRL